MYRNSNLFCELPVIDSNRVHHQLIWKPLASQEHKRFQYFHECGSARYKMPAGETGKNRKEVLAVPTSYRKEVLALLSCNHKEVLGVSRTRAPATCNLSQEEPLHAEVKRSSCVCIIFWAVLYPYQSYSAKTIPYL